MSRLKTSKEEKERVIIEVIDALKLKIEEEYNYDKGDFYNERISLIDKENDLDKKYKKACRFNNLYELNVDVRKTDRFGESNNIKETNGLYKEESNEEFIDACMKAEESVKVEHSNEDFEIVTASADDKIETNEIEVSLIKEAINKGVILFYSSFFNDIDKDVRKVGYKNNSIDVYYIKSVGLIEVVNNK